MKQFLLVLGLSAFPWFHARPAKNVHSVAYHGTAARSSGHLYFKDSYDRFRVPPRRHTEPLAVILKQASAPARP